MPAVIAISSPKFRLRLTTVMLEFAARVRLHDLQRSIGAAVIHEHDPIAQRTADHDGVEVAHILFEPVFFVAGWATMDTRFCVE